MKLNILQNKHKFKYLIYEKTMVVVDYGPLDMQYMETYLKSKRTICTTVKWIPVSKPFTIDKKVLNPKTIVRKHRLKQYFIVGTILVAGIAGLAGVIGLGAYKKQNRGKTSKGNRHQEYNRFAQEFSKSSEDNHVNDTMNTTLQLLDNTLQSALHSKNATPKEPYESYSQNATPKEPYESYSQHATPKEPVLPLFDEDDTLSKYYV